MSSHPLRKPDSAATGKLRVLAIEDNEFERKLLASVLRRLGVGLVEQVASGSEALALIANGDHDFDLVLCDLQMRERGLMDGIEFLRRTTLNPSTRLVLLSGLDEDLLMAAEILACASGASWSGTLRKPVVEEELAVLLAACANRPSVHPANQGMSSAQPRNWTKADIRMGIRRGEFLAHFQPKRCLIQGRLVGVEALARWLHPTMGMVPPAEFIPLMEREGLIDELSEIMLAKSLDAIAAAGRQGHALSVAINASPLTLENVDLPNRWRGLVEARGIDPSLVTVEVTETAIARNFHGLLESITRLRMHGFRISLDDFGTGYSSLQQMSELPVNELKIDRSFVERALHSRRATVILEAIVALARKLELSVVAEGVESAGHAAFVAGMGCDTGQGWHYGMPMPADTLVASLRAAPIPSIQRHFVKE